MNDQDRIHWWTQSNTGHYNAELIDKFRQLYNEYPTIEQREKYYLTIKNKDK
jgi:hypothetical protein